MFYVLGNYCTDNYTLLTLIKVFVYIWMRELPHGHRQERVMDMSLTENDYHLRPTPTMEDWEVEEVIAIPEGKAGTASRPVPDQFTFMFRVESRVTVIDRHQGHDEKLLYPECDFVIVTYVSIHFCINEDTKSNI